MDNIRSVVRELTCQPVTEGAGVHLKRGFSSGQERLFDPFLLFDDFSGDRPAQFMAGFPWHPHRGIETITYVLEGEVEHGDSLGNAGRISPGDVQWMTAGSGIIHQEMPQASPAGRLIGFQLWANLPAAHKMMAPRYRGIASAEIPELDDGAAHLRVVGGRIGGVEGPARDVVIEPEYLDVSLPPEAVWEHVTSPENTVFAYLFSGSAVFDPRKPQNEIQSGTIVLFSRGERLRAVAGPSGARFLLIGGKPLNEPVAWGGPIVMNTQEELRTAFAEYRAGTFIKHPGA